MKHLRDFVEDCIASGGDMIPGGVAPSIGAMKAASSYATPGNTLGMGNPKPPTAEEPGSGDVFGITRKANKKKKEKEKEKR